METKWHAVYTKPNCERRVAESLAKIKITNYYPVNRTPQHKNEGKKINEAPLFESYVFVKISENDYPKLKQVNGVVNFLHWMGKPVIVDESEIDMMRRFSERHINVKVEKTGVGINDTLSVINGSLMEHNKDVTASIIKKNIIGLPSIGYRIIGEFEPSLVPEKLYDNFISRSRSKLRFAVGMFFQAS